MLPAEGDLAVAGRTILELTATVMEAAFSLLGEGVILGTMPAYLERFGEKNARFVERHYVSCDPGRGAVSALTPMNFVSRITETPFTMVEASKDVAVKRLHACEFASAFDSKAPFAKAMVCMLHRAAYQGSVNGLLADPRRDGYDVTLQSRILFGDSHCDFAVQSRAGRPHEPDQEGAPRHAPDAAETASQVHHFYTAILVAFVDYLSSVLQPDEAALLLEDCAAKVGAKARGLLLAGVPAARASPEDLLQALLVVGGRTIERTPGPHPVLKVVACPYAHPIVAATKRHDAETARQVRANACRLCHGLVSNAVEAHAPGATVARDTCLTLGDADCRFRVERQGGP